MFKLSEIVNFLKNQRTMFAIASPQRFKAISTCICIQSTKRIASMLTILSTLPKAIS